VFELFRNPNIDFMSKRHLWLGISVVLMVASIVAIPIFGIRRGVELGGGAELQLEYATAPAVDAIRSTLAAAGFESLLVNSIGASEEREVYIRVAVPNRPAAFEEQEVTSRVVAALRTEEMRRHEASGRVDVNTASTRTLAALLGEAPGVSPARAEQAAAAIAQARNERGLFASVEEATALAALPPAAGELLHQRGHAGAFVVRSQSYIGPAIGRELVKKAVWAILGSLAGMLLYIWMRFQFRWSLAAVVALVHDVVITLGLFTVFGFEMSLPVIASFLTLIGYSVNDKVVVFDRMRENLGNHRGMELMKLLNDSMNQALSRTVLTSTLTWLAAIALFALGGPTLRDFAFPLMIGIVVGTYSSMYTAAPLLLLWQRFAGQGTAGAQPSRWATRTARRARASGA
jgi:preprotein translocase subunit SecF